MAELPLLSVSEWTQHAMPPIDVLMVWHAYLLNPSWYAEDTSRRPELRGIRTLSGYLLQAIVSRGHEAAATKSYSIVEDTCRRHLPVGAEYHSAGNVA